MKKLLLMAALALAGTGASLAQASYTGQLSTTLNNVWIDGTPDTDRQSVELKVNYTATWNENKTVTFEITLDPSNIVGMVPQMMYNGGFSANFEGGKYTSTEAFEEGATPNFAFFAAYNGGGSEQVPFNYVVGSTNDGGNTGGGDSGNTGTVTPPSTVIPDGAYVVFQNNKLGEGLTYYPWWNAAYNSNATAPGDVTGCIELKAASADAQTASFGYNLTGDLKTSAFADATLHFDYYAVGQGDYAVKLTAGDDYAQEIKFAYLNNGSAGWQTASISIAEIYPTVSQAWKDGANNGEGYIFSLVLSNENAESVIYVNNVYYTGLATDEGGDEGDEGDEGDDIVGNGKTYYGTPATLTFNNDAQTEVSVNWSATWNTEGTITFEATLEPAAALADYVGVSLQILNLEEDVLTFGYADDVYSVTTTKKYAENTVLTGNFFIASQQGTTNTPEFTYTVGSESEKPETPGPGEGGDEGDEGDKEQGFDPESASNLWNDAEVSLGATWFVNNDWQELDPQPEVAVSNEEILLTTPAGMGSTKWQGQLKIETDIDVIAGATYDFSCFIDSPEAADITVKLDINNEDGFFIGEGDFTAKVKADGSVFVAAEQVYSNGPDGKLWLVFDFAGYPNQTFSISDIYFGVNGDLPTAIEGIEIENSNAPVEFFNLNGMKVSNPENGIFIRRQGNNVSKVLVK